MEKRKTLQEEKAKLNKKVSTMPETQQEILRLSRDVESGRAVYMQLLNRQQELSIAKSSAIGNVRKTNFYCRLGIYLSRNDTT
ncbi:GNVR domain-containing protein [Klebsiella pneumoniae]|uniref:GNVR domain-containing protein n=1 Tax=Klebsiella pneumoniae TaxID=573 RepID=UPI003970F096